MTKNLCVIITQHNNSQFTFECIQSIVEQESEVDFSLILADNNSDEAEKELYLSKIRHLCPSIEIKEFDENYGFAKAHNLIISEVKEDYILLLNNDTVLLNDAISKLYHHGIKDQRSVLTGVLLNQDGSQQENTLGYFGFPAPILRLSTWFQNIFKEEKDVRRVFYSNGAFLLMKTSLFNDLGGFSEKYFIYSEDLEFMTRINKRGIEIYQYLDPKVMHYGGFSFEQVLTQTQNVKLKFKQGNEIIRQEYGYAQNLVMSSIFACFFCLKALRLLTMGNYKLSYAMLHLAYWRLIC